VSAFPCPMEHGCPPATRPDGSAAKPMTCDPDGPLVAEVVKTTTDPYVGRVSLVRVFSGTLRPDMPIHVSGHAHRDEIAEWIRLVRPRAVLPVHGDRRMLAAAGDVAVSEGIPRDRVHLVDNGDRIVLSAGGSARIEPGAVPCGTVYLDDRPELVDPEVVRERRRLSEEGFVVLLVRGDDVDVVSRGVAADPQALAGEVSRAAKAVLARASAEERADPEWLRAEIAIAAKRACRRELGLRPVIVPVLV